ncbi:hypothetical protein BJF89_02365 [Corynebacterium sp. CNJ-954]|nr:hypothetical protein BJF89_02365 [Corynebacterium sp. CNJ-954]
MYCVAEKSQFQAQDRDAPVRPLHISGTGKSPRTASITDQTPLFDGLEVVNGKVDGAAKPKDRPSESLGLPHQIDRAHPDQELYMVMGNDVIHGTAEVREELISNVDF